MTSTMVCYILNAMELGFLSLETDHEHRIMVILTSAYLVITVGYLIRGNEGFWMDDDHLCEHI